MKISCDREATLAAFQTAAAFAPSRSPKPILQCVKLEAVPGNANFMATDTELSIRVALPGIEIEAPGSAVLPVDRFGSILRECSAEKLRIEAEERGTKIAADRSRFTLPAMNPEEFPAVPVFAETSYIQAPARMLKELIRRTLFAVDTESGRFALAGVLLEIEGEKLHAIGSDGRRLAVMEGPVVAVEGGRTGNEPVIVPSRAMHLLERSLVDGDDQVLLAARSNDLLVRAPRFEFSSRLVEGRFPRWRDVIPKRSGSARIPLQAGPLLAAVRQASIVADNESRAVNFTFGEGTLTIRGSSDTAGQSQVEMPIAYDGAPIPTALDFRYISEFLRVLGPETTITLDLLDADSSALFTTEDGYSYVVMPMSTAGR